METIEYINEENIQTPDAKTIQNDFQYWLWIERLNWNTQVKNLWLEWVVKVSNLDKDWLYLNDTIVTRWSVSKTNTSSTIELNFSNNNLFWDWSDWEYIRTWHVVFWNANKMVYNFTNFTYYWDWTNTMTCWDRDLPIIINCTWDFTLSNAIIDFSWKFNSQTKSIIINYWWESFELLWNQWNHWNWWAWWKWYYCNSYPANNPINWQPSNWYIWGNWWNWNWAWACGCWFQVNSTWWIWWQSFGSHWQQGWWYASWWGWWAWWEWGKWWVPLIINVKWNLDLWYIVRLNWEQWKNWWDWWRWRWYYYVWCWYSYWNWWNWWNWADWWNWWGLYLNYWWSLTFFENNFERNWWNWWLWWQWWLYFESNMIDWVNWSNWLTWINWEYKTNKIVNAF